MFFYLFIFVSVRRNLLHAQAVLASAPDVREPTIFVSARRNWLQAHHAVPASIDADASTSSPPPNPDSPTPSRSPSPPPTPGGVREPTPPPQSPDNRKYTFVLLFIFKYTFSSCFFLFSEMGLLNAMLEEHLEEEDDSRRASPVPVEDAIRRASPVPVEDAIRRASPVPVEDDIQRASPVPIMPCSQMPKRQRPQEASAGLTAASAEPAIAEPAPSQSAAKRPRTYREIRNANEVNAIFVDILRDQGAIQFEENVVVPSRIVGKINHFILFIYAHHLLLLMLDFCLIFSDFIIKRTISRLIEEIFECTICCQIWYRRSRGAALECGHVFCLDCVEELRRRAQHNLIVCPVCFRSCPSVTILWL